MKKDLSHLMIDVSISKNPLFYYMTKMSHSMYTYPIVCKLYMRWDSFNWFATVLLLFIILTVEIEKYKKFHFENQGLKNQYLIVYHFFIKIFFCKEKIIFSLLQDWKLIENLNLKAYKKQEWYHATWISLFFVKSIH